MAAGKVTIEAFYDLIKQMREAQKAYFKSRKRTDLSQAIALEAKVDTIVEDRKKENVKQLNLYTSNENDT